MFNSSREIRERALSHRELVKGKRGFGLKVLKYLKNLKNIDFKKKAKDFLISSAVTGAATEAGNDIYKDATNHTSTNATVLASESNPTNTASTNATARAVAEWEERAPGHSLPADIFGEPYL